MLIQEYEIKPDFVNILALPEGAKVLDVQRDGGTIVMWAAADFRRGLTARRFKVLQTKQAMPEDLQYIGTVKVIGNTYHVFEEIPCP